MSSLKVHPRLRLIDETLSEEPWSQPSPAPYPFKVFTANGELIEEGVASSAAPAHVHLPESGDVVRYFVRLALPSGRAVTKSIDVPPALDAMVEFLDSDVGGEEWAKWAVARSAAPAARHAPLSRLGSIWVQVWSRRDEAWSLAPQFVRSGALSSLTAKQVDVELPVQQQHLLQFGGARVPRTFVALPAGRCRVYFTPSPDKKAGHLPMKVVVTSFRPDAETLLEFLGRDALKSAYAVGRFAPVATRLLHDKFDDPIGAVVGAYFLLRIGRWAEVDEAWFENLYRWFPWSGDAALIRAAVTCRRGLGDARATSSFVEQLHQFQKRGLPLFAEAHLLLVELGAILASVLVRGEGERWSQEARSALECMQALSAARVSAGTHFAFFGRSPDRPESQPVCVSHPESDASILEQAALGDAGFAVSRFTESMELVEAVSPRRPRSRAGRNVLRLKDL